MNEQMFKLRFQWAMGQTETAEQDARTPQGSEHGLLTIMREKSNG